MRAPQHQTVARRAQRGGFALHPAAVAAAGAGADSFRLPVLPWAVSSADERRFQGILAVSIVSALMAALALRFVVLPVLDRAVPPTLPAPMARLILERSPPPAVLPPAAQKAPRPAAATRPAAAAAQPAAQPAAAPRSAAAQATTRQAADSAAPPDLAIEQARRKAAGAGLLALRAELSALAQAGPAVLLQAQSPRSSAAATSGAGSASAASADAGAAARALVTAAAGRGSGGSAATASPNSRDSGSSAASTLAGRATTAVARPGAGELAVAAGKPAAVKAAGRPTRSLEDVKLVFERQKGAIYALYNRALRDDPALQGKVVIELKIAPAGHVESVRIVSSELKSEDLEKKLLARIRSFDFGAREVDPLVVTWPLDFLPG